MPFIENEYAAVKAKLAGLTVTDETAPSGRPVAVRYRVPESELANATFPMIIIQPTAMERASDREHRGFTDLPYWPEGTQISDAPGFDPDNDVHANNQFWVDYPIPYNFDFQITVYCRKQSHMLQLQQKLAKFDRLPTRFGFIQVPQDGTVRSLDLIGGPSSDWAKDQDGKRVFRSVYLIRVPGELFEYEVETISKVLIGEIDIDLIDTNSGEVTHIVVPEE